MTIHLNRTRLLATAMLLIAGRATSPSLAQPGAELSTISGVSIQRADPSARAGSLSMGPITSHSNLDARGYSLGAVLEAITPDDIVVNDTCQLPTGLYNVTAVESYYANDVIRAIEQAFNIKLGLKVGTTTILELGAIKGREISLPQASATDSRNWATWRENGIDGIKLKAQTGPGVARMIANFLEIKVVAHKDLSETYTFFLPTGFEAIANSNGERLGTVQSRTNAFNAGLEQFGLVVRPTTRSIRAITCHADSLPDGINPLAGPKRLSPEFNVELSSLEGISVKRIPFNGLYTEERMAMKADFLLKGWALDKAIKAVLPPKTVLSPDILLPRGTYDFLATTPDMTRTQKRDLIRQAIAELCQSTLSYEDGQIDGYELVVLPGKTITFPKPGEPRPEVPLRVDTYRKGTMDSVARILARAFDVVVVNKTQVAEVFSPILATDNLVDAHIWLRRYGLDLKPAKFTMKILTFTPNSTPAGPADK